MSPKPELRFSLDLFFQCSLEEFEQQVLLSLVGSIVVQSEDHGVQELCRFVLGHLKDQLRQIGWNSLKQSRGKKRLNLSEYRESPTINLFYH